MKEMLEQISLECQADKLTAETQRAAEAAQRVEEHSSLCAISATSLRLCGELFVPDTHVKTALNNISALIAPCLCASVANLC